MKYILNRKKSLATMKEEEEEECATASERNIPAKATRAPHTTSANGATNNTIQSKLKSEMKHIIRPSRAEQRQ